MAAIFVWLRYSSARHLTWQRNSNTHPRILGEAQAKLTHKIAEVCLATLPACLPALMSRFIGVKLAGHMNKINSPAAATLLVLISAAATAL